MTRVKQGALLLTVAVLAITWLTAGCGDRVSGDRFANQPPQLFFVNVPPDSARTSVDPEVNWIGTDRDGLIAYYRYKVVRQDELGGLDPDTYVQTVLSNLADTGWNFINVTPDDPATSNVVSLSADLDDPVSTYVGSYVFAQAFDDQGASSPIVYRLFLRNDNPPETDINVSNQVFIDAVTPGGAITGIRFNFEAEDPDPADSSFEFRWRVFGPYKSDPDGPGDEWEFLLDQFNVDAVVTLDSRVFIQGYGYVDTVISTSLQGGSVVVDTALVLIDTLTRSNIDSRYGSFQLVLDIDAFMADTIARPVDSSAAAADLWVSNNRDAIYRDSIFDIYRNTPSDVTLQRNFLLWGQCRDGARVVDGTPAWDTLEVVIPKYERDILILDFLGFFGRINAPYFESSTRIDSSRVWWKRAIENWNTAYQGGQIDFDLFRDTLDWIMLPTVGNQVSLEKLLSYKIIILYNDNVSASGFVAPLGGGPSALANNVFTSVDAGVNLLAMWRSPVEGGVNTTRFDSINTIAEYQQYFGVRQVVYSGWSYSARFGIGSDSTPVRLEDFTHALALDAFPGWPDLYVDTANLHNRYTWFENVSSDSAWNWEPGFYVDSFPGGSGDTIARKPDSTVYALPEVGWAGRNFGAETIYLYGSAFGLDNPFGTAYRYQGAPVGIRLETNLYRTAHFSFTPLGMEDASMQVVIDSLLNWLYDPNLGARSASTASAGARYSGAKVWVDPADVRARFEERQRRMEEDGFRSPPSTR